MNSQLGHRLHAHRVRRGWTQVGAAEAAVIDRTQLSRIERGEVGISVEALGRLARALELTPEECAELLDLAAGTEPAVAEEVVDG